MIPILFNHDSRQMCGTVISEHDGALSIRFADDWHLSREVLFEVFGNVGIIIDEVDDDGLVVAATIREFSIP